MALTLEDNHKERERGIIIDQQINNQTKTSCNNEV